MIKVELLEFHWLNQTKPTNNQKPQQPKIVSSNIQFKSRMIVIILQDSNYFADSLKVYKTRTHQSAETSMDHSHPTRNIRNLVKETVTMPSTQIYSDTQVQWSLCVSSFTLWVLPATKMIPVKPKQEENCMLSNETHKCGPDFQESCKVGTTLELLWKLNREPVWPSGKALGW